PRGAAMMQDQVTTAKPAAGGVPSGVGWAHRSESHHGINLVALLLCLSVPIAAPAAESLPALVERAQPKIAKLYGSGGFRGLEAYQTGVVISPEGHILTVLSHVLDTDYLRVVLDDGRRFDAELIGADPRTEIAVVKIDAADLPHFSVTDSPDGSPGTPILALSNLFGVATGSEPASVQHGTIAAVAPLDARRGRFEMLYDGPVYVLDATTNNPGAAGGALIDLEGRLLGILGKELRNAQTNTWVNFAMPIDRLWPIVQAIRRGELDPDPRENSEATAAAEPPTTLEGLGLVLVPDVLPRTPPYVEAVRPGTAAEQADIQPDDLIVMVGGRLVQSTVELRERLATVEAGTAVELSLLRGGERPELIELSLQGPLEPERGEP
ncbi:MAG: S1C family serine protease, partial [Pirellulales bacterium]